jgi:hypothetical protein
MARLNLSTGGALEITPVGYQFPGGSENEDDANWLRVHVEASFGEQSPAISQTAPAFQTWDLSSFVSAALSLRGSGTQATLEGLEPGLKVHIAAIGSSEFKVTVAAALEFAPELREPFDEPFIFVSRSHQFDVQRFAEELSQELARFPRRNT